MDRIEALKAERLELHQEQTKLHEEAQAAEKGLTDEQRERDDMIFARIEQIDDEAGRLERISGRQAGYNEQREKAVSQAVKGVTAPEGDSSTEKVKDTPTPFKGLGDFLGAVAVAGQRPHATHEGLLEIQAATGMSEGVPSEGGFLVQTDVASDLIDLAHERAVLAGRTDSRPIGPNSSGMKINAVDETSRVDGSRRGGIQAFWTAEAEALKKSKPKFRQMELSLQKLTGLYYATDEELKDTLALAANVARWFGDEFGFKIDDALMRGTGTGEPLGVLGHAGTVSIGKETGQAAKTVVKENIENMWAQVWPLSLPRGEWYINQDVWPQLFRLSQAVGVGGVPVYIPPGGISAAPFGSLMGRPVTPLEQCDTVGSVGDIMFADFGEYITIEKGGLEAAESIHVQFLTDETTFRFILRMDGQPKRNAALTPYKGTNKQSSFVTLDARA